MKGLIFTYALTLVGTVGGLVSPFHGLLCYVCFAIVKPEHMWPWSVPQGRYSLALALTMLIGWTITQRATFQVGKSWGIVMFLLAYLGWSIAGAVVGQNQELAWTFIENLAKIVMPFCIGLTTIDSVSKLKQLAWVMVCSQGYVALELNVSYFSGYNVLATSGFGLLDNNCVAIALVTGMGLGFFLGFHAESFWAKCIAWGSSALMGHAVLFSFSRGGMVASVLCGLAACVVIRKTPRSLLLMLLVAGLGLAFAGEEVRDRFMLIFTKKDGQREESAQSRVELWANCEDLMHKYPIMGCGPNHFPLRAADYGWPVGKEAHSLWMQAGAEQGYVGLGLLVLFYLTTIVKMWMLTWKTTQLRDPWLLAVGQMVFSALAGFMVAAQFVSVESLEIPYYTVLLGCGALKLQTIPIGGRKTAEAVLAAEDDGRRGLVPALGV